METVDHVWGMRGRLQSILRHGEGGPGLLDRAEGPLEALGQTWLGQARGEGGAVGPLGLVACWGSAAGSQQWSVDAHGVTRGEGTAGQWKEEGPGGRKWDKTQAG